MKRAPPQPTPPRLPVPATTHQACSVAASLARDRLRGTRSRLLTGVPTSARRAGGESAVIGAVTARTAAVTAVIGAVIAVTGAVTAVIGAVSSVIGEQSRRCVASGAAPAVTAVMAVTAVIAARQVSRRSVSYRQYG